MYDPIKDARVLIEELLEQEVPRCSTAKEQMIRERGYLTGLLCRLMSDDSYAYNFVEQRIIKRQRHKK